MLFALLMWMSALVVMAGPSPPTHWVHVPPSGVDLVRIQVDGDGVLALGDDGSLRRWDGERWSLAAPPPPAPDIPTCFARAPDGALWVSSRWSAWARRFDGQWGPHEVMPAGYVFDLAVAPDGLLWAVGIHGYAVRRSAEGWARIPDLPLDRSTDSNLSHVLFDGQGRVWLWDGLALLMRLEGDKAWRMELDDEPRFAVRLDEDGRPLLLGRSVRRLDEPGMPTLLDLQLQDFHQGVGGTWGVMGGEVVDLGGGTPRVSSPPTPLSVRALVMLASGQMVAWDEQNHLFQTRPGAAPRFKDVSEDWGLVALTERVGAATGDVDGDGLDDLVVRSDAGSLRVLLQRAGAFEDHSEDLRQEVGGSGRSIALCDLDGNGQTDLVLREPVQEGSEGAGQLRVLRSLPGWVQQVPLPELAPAATRGTGLLTCVDLDADGDLDIVASNGHRSVPPGPRVVMLENTGFGHLVPIPLPHRGPAECGGWVQELLVEDLDLDGHQDLVCLNTWDRGHRVFQGLPDFGLREVTSGSGLDAVYSDVWQGWAADVDGDGRSDLVTLDLSRGVRAWRNMSGFVFEDWTARWGLDVPPPWHRKGEITGLLQDLDGDGWLDLLAGNGAGAYLWVGSPDGFLYRPGVLPPLEGLRQVLSLDLGGDGDSDLLFIRKGPDVLLENRASHAAGVQPRPGRGAGVRHGLQRRLAWAGLSHRGRALAPAGREDGRLTRKATSS